jgi:DNA-binding CsgD family transcriptional regulator
MKIQAIANELTKSEKDIFFLAITKMTKREIGNELKVTESTVNFHLTNIFKKLGVTSRLELVCSIVDYNMALMYFKLHDEVEQLKARLNELGPNNSILPIGMGNEDRIR